MPTDMNVPDGNRGFEQEAGDDRGSAGPSGGDLIFRALSSSFRAQLEIPGAAADPERQTD
jgi:hypothetical protein